MLKTEIKNEFLKLTGVAAAIKGSIDTESGIVDKILTESLYDNTIGSPPREILMNSIDAMFQAGKGGEKVTIKFPNELDNDFYIKDSGVGLTPDEVKYLFQTLGASKKRRTGENGEMAMKHLTGEFGLGSKAFFAYTDAGWVVAAKDGMQETFFLSYDGDGNRVCIPVEGSRTEAPSDWQSGVCVGYAIKPSDFSRFYSEVTEVLRWVDYPVEILGYEQEIIKPVPLNKGHGWATYSSNDVRQHYVRMGRIVYPLNTHRLGDIKTAWLAVLQTVQLVLDVDNKAVDVVASREALKYSEKTVSVLREKLDAVVQEYALMLLENAQKALDGNWLERVEVAEYAAKNYSRLGTKITEELVALMGLLPDDRFKLLGVLNDRFAPMPRWVGDGHYKHSAWSVAPQESKGPFATHVLLAKDPQVGVVYNPVRVYGFAVETSQKGRRRVEKFRKYEITHGSYLPGSSSTEAKPESVPYQRLVTIAIEDSTHARERIKEAVEKGTLGRVYMLSAPKGTPKTELDSYAQRLSDEMGGWDIIRISELPVPQSILLQRQRRKEAKEQALKGLAHSEAKLLKWDGEKNTFVVVTEDMSAILEMAYPEETLDENGNPVEVEPNFQEMPLLIPFRFGRDEVVLPGDSRENPNTIGYTFFIETLTALYSCAGEAIGETARNLLFLPPASIKSGKLLAGGVFKLFAEEVKNHLDYSLVKDRYASLAAGLPEILPFRAQNLGVSYYERNLVKLLILSYVNSLEVQRTEDDAESEPVLQESVTSAMFKEAINLLSATPGFEKLPLLASLAFSPKVSGSAFGEVEQFQNLLVKLKSAPAIDNLVNGPELRNVVRQVKLPERAEEVMDKIGKHAAHFENSDFMKLEVNRSGPVMAVQYFLALRETYLNSLVTTQLKKVA